MTEKLTLFPLGAVLMPGGELMLRIHEEIYLNMARKMSEENKPVGFVYSDDEDELSNVASIGCIASVVEFTEFEDNSAMLRVRGLDRFEIQKIDESSSVLKAEVRYFEDVDMYEEQKRLVDTVQEQLAEYQHLVATVDPDMLHPGPVEPSSPEFSFQVLDQIAVTEEVRYEAMRMTQNKKRLEYCRDLMRKEISTLKFLMDEDMEEDSIHMVN